MNCGRDRILVGLCCFSCLQYSAGPRLCSWHGTVLVVRVVENIFFTQKPEIVGITSVLFGSYLDPKLKVPNPGERSLWGYLRAPCPPSLSALTEYLKYHRDLTWGALKTRVGGIKILREAISTLNY